MTKIYIYFVHLLVIDIQLSDGSNIIIMFEDEFR